MPVIDGETVDFSDNQAGYKFVVPTASGKWAAKPTLEKGGKQIDFGSFDTPEEAAVVAARAVRQHKEGTLEPKVRQKRAPKTSKKRERCAHSNRPPLPQSRVS